MKKGIDFFVAGDYGHIANMSIAQLSFEKMDQIMDGASNTTNPRDLIDFIVTAGDNIYPTIPNDP